MPHIAPPSGGLRGIEPDVSKALRLVSSDLSPTARVFKAALQRANRSEREIRRAVETVALEEIPNIRGATVYLPSSPTGHPVRPHRHHSRLDYSLPRRRPESAATRQAILFRGISIAFYNTFFGLVVATISIVFYLILIAKTNGTLALMERSASQVIDSILWFRDQGRRSA